MFVCFSITESEVSTISAECSLPQMSFDEQVIDRDDTNMVTDINNHSGRSLRSDVSGITTSLFTPTFSDNHLIVREKTFSQNSPALNCVLDSTTNESRHSFFSEHRKTTSSDTIISSSQYSTTSQHDQRKPNSALSDVVKNKNNNRKRLFDSNQQQLQQQLPQHHILPPTQHTATAAEIALGIPASYGQRQTMGDGSRSSSMILYADHQHREYDREMNIPQRKEMDEEKASGASTDSATVTRPGRMAPIHNESSHHQNTGIMIGTPSTVSTAPSSDDEALIDYKLDETTSLPYLLQPIHQEGNNNNILHNRQHTRLHQNQNPWTQQMPPNPLHTPQKSWDGATSLLPNQHSTEQRVATFRNDGNFMNQQAENPQQTQQIFQISPKKDYYSPQQSTHQRQQQLQVIPTLQTNRRLTYAHYAAKKDSSPPRIDRNQRQHGNISSRQAPSSGQGSGHHQNISSSRSPSEILKTLLRKKACLYEPETSRAVSLVTWLVGRVLALELGFFSRQQLQCGVHACVAAKIKSKIITRTKVNRCMQIILNSCFHYIIPRSDGSEEKGDHFRSAFSETVQDDSIILRQLPEPWNDLIVDKNTVIDAILKESGEKSPHQRLINTCRSPSTSPKSSPKFGSINPDRVSDRYHNDSEKEEASKRAVLLCFNENVRSAEDIFRCHNDFIRDTANAANLQLTTKEWRQFFGRESSCGPHIWSIIDTSSAVIESSGQTSWQHDIFGQMSTDEVGKFRNTWCKKRYDHDHDLCGFAHADINGGWLRRNPMIYSYKNEMCKFVYIVQNKNIGPIPFYLNECPNGVTCGYAHSLEEINYHPMNYKINLCKSMCSSSGGCRFGDVCPNIHPPDSNQPFKKTSDGHSLTGHRGRKNLEQTKFHTRPYPSDPSRSPVVYASPAPFSMFERQLALPGLQNLYRRQSEVVRAYVHSSGNFQCSCSLFSDTWGIPSAI